MKYNIMEIGHRGGYCGILIRSNFIAVSCKQCCWYEIRFMHIAGLHDEDALFRHCCSQKLSNDLTNTPVWKSMFHDNFNHILLR